MKHTLTLNDAFKTYTRDLDKMCPPEETVRRFRERLTHVDLDILQDAVRIDNGRLDIPVFFSLCGRDAEAVIGTKKQMGKGGSSSQAEASALMELAERFSLFSFCKDPSNFVVDTYEAVRDRAVPLEMICRSVHDDTAELERLEDFFVKVPFKWVWGYNLTRGKSVLVPFDWFFAINEFNGPSAGNCMEEAVLQGICEVVERHVSSVVSRGKMTTPVIDPDSAADPLARELVAKFRDAGIELFLSDFSLDTGIPTVGALAYDPSTFPEKSEIVWTAGTTADPEKALIRAVTEVAQLSGDFNTGSTYVASGLPKLKTLSEAAHVTGGGDAVPLSSLPDLSHDNIKVEVERCVEALSRGGMEVIVIDVTHPALEVPAAYTIVPGAHFRERTTGTSMGMLTAKLIADSGNPEWAIDELKKMDTVVPGRYYTVFFLGMMHLSTGRFPEALGYFEEALVRDPEEQDLPTVYSYMGVCLKELERYRETIETLEKAEQYDDERTDIHNLKGFCYYKLKEHEKAIACFEKVLRLNPASGIDYANIASNYREMGDRDGAIRYYRRALELDPSLDFARQNLRILERE